jgi:hypothetical protein
MAYGKRSQMRPLPSFLMTLPKKWEEAYSASKYQERIDKYGGRMHQVEDYISSLGRRISRYAKIPEYAPTDFDYNFYVLNSSTYSPKFPTVSGFADAGGNIYILGGRFRDRKGMHEGKLYALLAHEIAHIARRHGLRLKLHGMGREKAIQYLRDRGATINEYELDSWIPWTMTKDNMSKVIELDADEFSAMILNSARIPSDQVLFYKGCYKDGSGKMICPSDKYTGPWPSAKDTYNTLLRSRIPITETPDTIMPLWKSRAQLEFISKIPPAPMRISFPVIAAIGIGAYIYLRR